MSINLSDIAILIIKGSDYCCIISGISKNDAINLMPNVDLTEKSGTLIKHKSLLSHIKMGIDILMFGDIEIEKKEKIYHHKSPVPLRDVDIEKVLVSNKISSGEKNCKYFIGYLYYDHKVKQLHIMLPKRMYLQTKWIYCLI